MKNRSHWCLSPLLLLGMGVTPQLWAQGQALQAVVLHSQDHRIQKVPLSLAQMAALQQYPRHVVVLDAQQQVMPSRIALATQANKTASMPLQVFAWPERAGDAYWQQVEKLKWQFKQGEVETTVWQPMTPTQPQASDDTQQARTWLLQAPAVDTPLQADAWRDLQLHVTWQAQALSSAVRVEGSNNLSDWHLAGLGHILETNNTTQQLKQQRIEVQQPYRFWRVRFDQPIALQHANLAYQHKEAASWRTEQFELVQTHGSPSSWQLTAPYPLQVARLSVDVPTQQLWTVQLSAQIHADKRWQTLRHSSVFNLHQSGQHHQSNHIMLARPVVAQQWRLNIQGAQPAQLGVTLAAPQRYVVFLAQGEAPYTVQVGAAVPESTAQLPAHLLPTHEATMGEVSVHVMATPTRQYLLWVGLVAMVLLLAVAAWRVLRSMPHEPKAP